MCSWLWIVLTITYLKECPLNTGNWLRDSWKLNTGHWTLIQIGMIMVSVMVCYISNFVSDYRMNLPAGKLTRLLYLWNMPETKAWRGLHKRYCFFVPMQYNSSLVSGWTRMIFNFSCVILASWTLRIFYPCVLDICNLELEVWNF